MQELRPGIEIRIEIVKPEQVIKEANLVIADEEKINHQNIHGEKTLIALAKPTRNIIFHDCYRSLE